MSQNENSTNFLEKIGDKIKKVLGSILGFIKNHKVLTIIVIFILIIAIIGINIFSKMNAMKSAMENTSNMPMTTSLTRMDLTSSVSVTGTIASADSRSISTTLTGTEIKEVHVSVGDYVNAGDVIVTFDSTDLEKDLETAEDSAALNNLKNEKSLDDATENLTEAQENYTNQAASMQQEVNSALSNYNNLAAKRDAALATYEAAQEATAKAQENYNNSVSTNGVYSAEAKTALEQAKQAESKALAAYEEYNKQAATAYGNYYGRLNEQTENNAKNADQIEDSDYSYRITVLEQQNSRKTQNEQIQAAEEKLGQTVVTSPISGVITAVNVEAGDTYDGGALFVVQDMEHFVVDATVDEYDIADISKDLKAVVKTDATDDEELSGTVTFVAPTPGSSSSSNSSAGTTSAGMSGMSSTTSSSGYEIQITLDDSHDRLRIGMTAKTSIILASAEDVYAVAYDCVQTDGDGNSYIEVIENSGNEKAKIYVDIGMESDYYVEIISDELYEGMQIVVTASSGDNNSNGFPDMPNMDEMPSGGMPERDGNMGGGPGGGMPGGF